jgi:cell division protein FtsW
MVFSASSVKAYQNYNDSLYYFKRHMVWILLGLISFLVFSKINYRKLRKYSGAASVVSLFLLVAVLIPGVGLVINGARRWINLGFLSFQPSEISKISLVIYGATVMATKKGRFKGIKELVNPFSILVLISAVLTIRQPDLGTAMILGINALLLFFLGGLRLREFGLISIASGLAVIGAIVMEDYRRQRFLAFLNPWADPRKSGFHIIQSLLAFGSGGIFGAGLGKSLQKFSYLPQAHTDFIFAIVGEELGLIGTLIVILLFLGFGYFGLRVAYKSSDRFGKILAGTIVGSILTQAAINIGAVSGVLPITGIPLPFISYGGTSLLINLTYVGILTGIGNSQRIEVLSESNDLRGRNRGTPLSGNRPGKSSSSKRPKR